MYDSCCILFFVTQVAEAKHEKLGGVVRKVFSRMGTIAEDGLTHPFDQATGLTKGFAFVNFLNPQDAKQAAATLNGWQLDKSHNIKVRREVAFTVLQPVRLAKDTTKKDKLSTALRSKAICFFQVASSLHSIPASCR